MNFAAVNRKTGEVFVDYTFDNTFFTISNLARTMKRNYELVQNAVGIIESLGCQPATLDEARRIFGTFRKDKDND